MGNIIIQTEETNRDACVAHNLIVCDESETETLDGLRDMGIVVRRPGDDVVLWSGGFPDGKWKTLKELGLDDKFYQLVIPEEIDLSFEPDEECYSVYYLVDSKKIAVLGCHVSLNQHRLFGGCELIKN